MLLFQPCLEGVLTSSTKGIPSLASSTNYRRPGLLDSAVFAYTWTVLDKLGDSSLASIIKKFDNLVRHADNLKHRVYSA